MVPTRRLLILIALGIPVACASALLGSPSLIWAYNVGLLFASLVTYYLAPSARGSLRVSRKMDSVLSVRVPNRIELTLTNDGLEPLHALFRDEPPPTFTASRKEFDLAIAPGRETTFFYNLTPPERGADYFRGAFVRTICPLGLVYKTERLPLAQPVRVYPNILALREFDLLKQKGRLQQVGIRRSRLRGLGTEFESLRDYSEGDDFRKIDWKASARRGKLVVRQYEQEKNQAVIVAIDIGRQMLAEVEGVRKLDRALDSCLMLLHAAATAGDQVGLLVYSDRVRRYIPPRKGRNQIGIILNAIHDLVAEPVETDHLAAMSYLNQNWKRRSLLVLFTDLDGQENAQSLTAALAPVTRRHLSVIARVADSRLLQTYDQPLASTREFYERAAAEFLIADRRRAASVLNNAGLHNLEAEPDELSAKLVNFYFVVKERALL